jgi:hypothetical protein
MTSLEVGGGAWLVIADRAGPGHGPGEGLTSDRHLPPIAVVCGMYVARTGLTLASSAAVRPGG